MNNTFYFYDLETTGFSARAGRIMQFAGQRTDTSLNPIGNPHNFLIKITPDILPDPDAILVTGITPQKTLEEGISEAEFLKVFHSEIATPDTIFTGFNNIRFDDEFIRFTNYRNFYDSYEWQWSNGRSKWDIMDVCRMTRALRPEGIKWPFSSDGKPSGRLELIANVNKIEHLHAHDALSDVFATIGVAKLIKEKQSKLFNYLLKIRDKKQVEKLVSSGDPFVYTSGKFSSDFEKTTIALTITAHPNQSGSVFVYDLREDPNQFLGMSVKEIAQNMQKWKFEEGELRLPVKQLQYNRCPAVAPVSVLDDKTKKRLKIDDKKIKDHLKILISSDLGDKVLEAVRLNEKDKQTNFIVDIADVDAQLYEGFFNDADKKKISTVRAADETKLADLNPDFNDSRLKKLLVLYKARQFPKSLNETEQKEWDLYRTTRLMSGDSGSRIEKYVARINELSSEPSLKDKNRYLLEELLLYGQSIIPYEP